MNTIFKLYYRLIYRDFLNALRKGKFTMSDLTVLAAAIDQAIPVLSEVASLRAQVKTLTDAATADQAKIDELATKLKAATPV